MSRLVRGSIGLAAVLWITGSACAQSTATGRPILFVHGWCGDADGWGTLQENVTKDLTLLPQSPYTGLNNTAFTLYYDSASSSVKLFPSGQDFLTSGLSASRRFFSINFYAAGAFSDAVVDTTRVCDVSILNKADELAQVIHAITTVTHVKDVIVIAHSMGGLVTRAYMQNWAIPSLSPCTDQDAYRSCTGGQATPYAKDIARLITLDTPHGGAIVSNIANALLLVPPELWSLVFGNCASTNTLNRRELQERSLVINSLNADASTLPSGVAVASIQSYRAPCVFCSDDLLTTQEQSITNVAPVSSLYYDLPNSFSSPLGCPVLHFLSCVGIQPSTASLIEQQVAEVMDGQLSSVSVQATLDGSPWTGTFGYSLTGPSAQTGNGPSIYNDVVPGTYNLAYTGGGPSAGYSVLPAPQQMLGFDSQTGVNNWNLTFTVAFTSAPASPPAVTTLTAVGIPGGATVTGTVNPNGNPATAWFEWGTSSTLVSSSSTPVQSAGSGASPETITFDLSGLAANTPYYYRIAASGVGPSTVRGTIWSFATQGNLPAPTLLTPGNGMLNVPYPPSFSWSDVASATSYRLIVATNPGALPTSATVGTCGTGCVLNVTPTGTSYKPPAGSLAPNTTYYWEVHARSSIQFGD